MMSDNDTMKITILPDGRIKVETDEISTPNHTNAGAFLAEMSRMVGGQVTIEAKRGAQHTHTHHHEDQAQQAGH